MALTFTTGHLEPTKLQLQEALKRADDSFEVNWSAEFQQHIPTVLGWEPDLSTGILLKLANVTPHADDWVGSGPYPRRHRSIFWLLSISPKAHCIHLGVGHRSARLEPGDWILFSHTVEHWVMSSHTWRGAAWQLRG